MDVEKVAEIIEPNFKNGMGKTGKPWSMAKIVTDQGKSVTVFNPVNVGDEIELTYNEQYKNWSGKVKQNSHRTYASNPEITERLTRIEKKLDMLMGDFSEPTPPTPQPQPRPEPQAPQDKPAAWQEMRQKFGRPFPDNLPEPPEPGYFDERDERDYL